MKECGVLVFAFFQLIPERSRESQNHFDHRSGGEEAERVLLLTQRRIEANGVRRTGRQLQDAEWQSYDRAPCVHTNRLAMLNGIDVDRIALPGNLSDANAKPHVHSIGFE